MRDFSREWEQLDREWARIERAFVGTGLLAASIVCLHVAAVVGPFSATAGVTLLVLADVPGVIGLVLLISAPFVARGIAAPRDGSFAGWDLSRLSDSPALGSTDANDEPCACTNCMNQRAW